MKLDDFQKHDVEYPGENYVRSTPVPSLLGDFTVEMTVGEGEVPDQDLMDRLQGLIDRFQRDAEKVASLLHESYREFVEQDPEWFEDVDIPTDLKVDQLAAYLDFRSLTIDSEPNHRGEEFPARVYISPQWDEEHGFYLRFDGSDWQQVDC